MDTAVLDQTLAGWHAEMQSLRHDFHAHPELCFEEQRTCSIIKAKLAQWNINVVESLAQTGLVAVIKGQRPGSRAIGLRADMDALPMQEENTFAHASKYQNKMHGCGHDGHMLTLLAAGRFLAQHNDFAGTVYLVFQPAEEIGCGASKMIDDGLFERFPMDAIFGMHNWPGLPLGHFGVKPGPIMASTNTFHITVRGKGAHAAMPQLAVDPVVAVAQLVLALQTIVSRNLDPLSSGVLSVTQMNAGTAYNVIPSFGTIVGSVRTLTMPALDLIEKRVRAFAATIPNAFDCQVDVDFVRGDPPTVNHPKETAFCTDVLTRTFGEDQVHTNIEPSMAAEDFATMLLQKPGCYVWIGNGEMQDESPCHGLTSCSLHNSHYDFNDQLIDVGARYWVELAQAWLAD